MISSISFSIFFLLNLFYQLTAAAFDASGKDNFVVYWGQASAGKQERLSSYCDDSVDMVLVSFMTAFPGTNDVPSLNFANACYEQYSNGLLHCSTIGQDIQTCQDKGIKVLLSLGGASGAYGFSDDAVATDFADTLWDLFGEGTSDTRPFDDAVVDGFDLDIENNNPDGYAALVKQLRTNFKSGSKDYYISAAPQCPIPDASLNDVLVNADVDFAFIQFYNNYCKIGSSFNFDDWVTWAENDAYNKDIKLYLGLPASSSAAGSGYVDIDSIKSTVQDISCSSYFGGISTWDASQAYNNEVNGETWAAAVRGILDSDICSNSSSSSLSASSTSSPASAVTSNVSATSSTSATPSTSATLFSSSVISSASSSAASSSAASSSAASSSAASSSAAVNSSETSTGHAPPSTSLSSVPLPSLTNAPTSRFSVTTDTTTTIYTSVSSVQSVAPGGSTTNYYTTVTYSTTLEVVHPGSSSTLSSYSSTAASTTGTSAPTSAPTAPVSSTFATSAYSQTSTSSTSDSGTAAPEPKGCASYTGEQRARCLNENFDNDSYYTHNLPCTDGTIICRADGALAQCDHGAWVTFQCATGTSCFAYTSGSNDVSITCNFSYLKSAFT